MLYRYFHEQNCLTSVYSNNFKFQFSKYTHSVSCTTSYFKLLHAVLSTHSKIYIIVSTVSSKWSELPVLHIANDHSHAQILCDFQPHCIAFCLILITLVRQKSYVNEPCKLYRRRIKTIKLHYNHTNLSSFLLFESSKRFLPKTITSSSYSSW